MSVSPMSRAVAREDEFWPIVSRLRAFRGIDTLSALVIVLEVGDFRRFARAVQLGSWLGLVPSRQQSGEADTHGPITKTGSRYARRILVEAAWHYLREPRIGVTLAARHDGLPDHILQIAWRAQHRLHRRLRAHKKPPNVVNVAVARELACFIWAAATSPWRQPTAPPPARVGRRQHPQSAGTHGSTMGARKATPAPRQALADDETGTWGATPAYETDRLVEDRPAPPHASNSFP